LFGDATRTLLDSFPAPWAISTSFRLQSRYRRLATGHRAGVVLYGPPQTIECYRRIWPTDGTVRLYCRFEVNAADWEVHLVITLLVIALITGVLGFGGIAGAAVGIAKIIFFVALVLFLVSLIFGGMRGSFGRRL
jgi:uncharacterized membrane protein YtjA (UPF0391 family)